ncbi:TnsA-like heteromeric transposase endonuclease subunit [Streptomyces sp. NPDC003007]
MWSVLVGDLWWACGYESWLERDHLMLLDFDPLVMGMSSQPFRLPWTGPNGKRVRHTPDFFVRRADGTGLVVDVRPDERIEPDDAAKFTVTAAASQSVGWDFQRVGTPDEVLMANGRWLAATGVRGCTARRSHPRQRPPRRHAGPRRIPPPFPAAPPRHQPYMAQHDHHSHSSYADRSPLGLAP